MLYITSVNYIKSHFPKFFFFLKRIKKDYWTMWNFLLYKLNKGIVIDGYLFSRYGNLINNNFGDDINIPLIEELTGRKVYLRKDVGVQENLLCIGSIIEYYTSKGSVIWGSGALLGSVPIKQKPKKVYAVRGKLTKNYLENQGISCPNIFGDPATLIPIIYTPMVRKKYPIGIIPNGVDFDLPHVTAFKASHPEVLFIKFNGYESWKTIIDQICSCEIIVSSSLHGLILSDAYNIPNIWVRFSDKILGGNFKYLDYFSGVNRENCQSLDFRFDIDLNIVYEKAREYTPLAYSPKTLLRHFPYKLKRKYFKYAFS